MQRILQNGDRTCIDAFAAPQHQTIVLAKAVNQSRPSPGRAIFQKHWQVGPHALRYKPSFMAFGHEIPDCPRLLVSEIPPRTKQDLTCHRFFEATHHDILDSRIDITPRNPVPSYDHCSHLWLQRILQLALTGIGAQQLNRTAARCFRYEKAERTLQKRHEKTGEQVCSLFKGALDV